LLLFLLSSQHNYSVRRLSVHPWSSLLQVHLRVDNTTAVSAPCFLVNPDHHALSSKLHTSRVHIPGRSTVRALLVSMSCTCICASLWVVWAMRDEPGLPCVYYTQAFCLHTASTVSKRDEGLRFGWMLEEGHVHCSSNNNNN
jgi:hypothetical protein